MAIPAVPEATYGLFIDYSDIVGITNNTGSSINKVPVNITAIPVNINKVNLISEENIRIVSNDINLNVKNMNIRAIPT